MSLQELSAYPTPYSSFFDVDQLNKDMYPKFMERFLDRSCYNNVNSFCSPEIKRLLTGNYLPKTFESSEYRDVINDLDVRAKELSARMLSPTNATRHEAVHEAVVEFTKFISGELKPRLLQINANNYKEYSKMDLLYFPAQVQKTKSLEAAAHKFMHGYAPFSCYMQQYMRIDAIAVAVQIGRKLSKRAQDPKPEYARSVFYLRVCAGYYDGRLKKNAWMIPYVPEPFPYPPEMLAYLPVAPVCPKLPLTAPEQYYDYGRFVAETMHSPEAFANPLLRNVLLDMEPLIRQQMGVAFASGGHRRLSQRDAPCVRSYVFWLDNNLLGYIMKLAGYSNRRMREAAYLGRSRRF